MLLAALLIGGCSALRLGYNQGSTLAYWWIDGYVDFSAEQSPRAKAALEDWFAWHRATQLPDYAELLASLRARAVDNLTPGELCEATAQTQQRFERAIERAVPAMAAIARSLTPAQIDHIEKKYARNNADRQHELLQADPVQRREASLKRTIDRAEDYYGRLDAPQRKLLADALGETGYDAKLWDDEHIARQRDILRGLRKLVAERGDEVQAEALLRGFGADSVRSPRPQFRALAERVTAANCVVAARLHNATNPSQRRKLQEKLRSWEDDIQALLKAPVSSTRVARSPAVD